MSETHTDRKVITNLTTSLFYDSGTCIPQVVEKSWGRELIFINTPSYCMKELIILPKQSTSMHFHINKLETLYVKQGTLAIYSSNKSLFKQEIIVNEGTAFTIGRGFTHKLINLTDRDLHLIEASEYSEDSDSIRLE